MFERLREWLLRRDDYIKSLLEKNKQQEKEIEGLKKQVGELKGLSKGLAADVYELKRKLIKARSNKKQNGK